MKKPKKPASRVAALVQFCGHRGTFVADISVVAGAAVVRASGPITMENLNRDPTRYALATHHVADFPGEGFWRPELGVLVVPAEQVTVLAGGSQ
jgi:hypothetical protein